MELHDQAETNAPFLRIPVTDDASATGAAWVSTVCDMVVRLRRVVSGRKCPYRVVENLGGTLDHY
jgi:hypothetical protein